MKSISNLLLNKRLSSVKTQFYFPVVGTGDTFLSIKAGAALGVDVGATAGVAIGVDVIMIDLGAITEVSLTLSAV